MMRALRLATVLAVLAGPTLANQDDARLDRLFEQLAAAEDPVVARILEQRIWAIWGEIDDADSQTLLERGSVAMANNNYGEALASFDELVEREPDFAEGWNKRATLYWILGDNDASVRDIERTLTLEPRHFGALSGFGLILMAEGRNAAALGSFQAALALNPFLPAARHHILLLQQELGGEPL